MEGDAVLVAGTVGAAGEGEMDRETHPVGGESERCSLYCGEEGEDGSPVAREERVAGEGVWFWSRLILVSDPRSARRIVGWKRVIVGLVFIDIRIEFFGGESDYCANAVSI